MVDDFTLPEARRRIEAHDKELDEMWRTINAVRNRPPIWMGALVTALFGLCCTLLTLLLS